MTDVATILQLSDSGAPVQEIAARERVSIGRVYFILRRHRPDRPRQPRTRTSDVPHKIKGLLAAGIKPSRVAFLLGVSRQYVYRVQAEPVGLENHE